MPTETTATLLLGPVTRVMGAGHGTMRAQTLLTLDEGSRASWRITELTDGTPGACSHPDAPEQLLAHGLLGYIASRAADDFALAENKDLGPLVSAGERSRTFRTRTTDATPAALAKTLGQGTAIVATILAGSTLQREEVERLAAMGVRIHLAGCFGATAEDR